MDGTLKRSDFFFPSSVPVVPGVIVVRRALLPAVSQPMSSFSSYWLLLTLLHSLITVRNTLKKGWVNKKTTQSNPKVGKIERTSFPISNQVPMIHSVIIGEPFL